MNESIESKLKPKSADISAKMESNEAPIGQEGAKAPFVRESAEAAIRMKNAVTLAEAESIKHLSDEESVKATAEKGTTKNTFNLEEIKQDLNHKYSNLHYKVISYKVEQIGEIDILGTHMDIGEGNEQDHGRVQVSSPQSHVELHRD